MLAPSLQSCPPLCDPVDCSLPGSSVHGILQLEMLEWVAISFSRGSSQPRDFVSLFIDMGTKFAMFQGMTTPSIILAWRIP